MATDTTNINATHVRDDGPEPAPASATTLTPRPPRPAAPDGPVTLKWIEKLCDLAGLPAAGWHYVRRAFLEGPSRRVQAGRGNICARYPSRKMGRVIQAESLIELAAVLDAEHDAAVTALLDQPGPVPVTYAVAGGRRKPYLQSYLHTPDFLILRTSAFQLVECKPLKDLRRLADKHPDRWVHADGRWRFVPGEEAAAELGYEYRVVTDADIRPVYTANLSFIARYVGAESAEPDAVPVARIRELLDARPGVTILELLDDGAVADDLYRMIATGSAYVDLERERLADTDQTRVFPDRARYELWRAVQQGDPYPLFGAPDGSGAATSPLAPVEDIPEPVLGAMSTASAEAAATAVERFRMIRPVVCDGKPWRPVAAACGVAPRTFRRLCAAWRKEQANSGRGIIGLIPRTEHRGIRRSRLDKENERLIARVLAEGDDARNRRVNDLYGEYCEKAKAKGFKPAAPATFRKRIRLLDAEQRTRRRRGHKAAAAEAPYVWWIDRATPPHGQYPWDIVHIDHTQVDLMLRLGKLKPRLLRVWLTIVFCAHSRTVLGFEVSFDPPSNASVMMALRDCVRRHRRLPYTIVVDRGGEFESTWFELFCVQYLITKNSRPAGRPRFGSPIERFFGTANTQFFHALQGNTQLLRNPRGMTPEVDPRRHAVWTLEMLTSALETYFFEVYPKQPHPALGETPQEAYDRGLLHTGEKAHRVVEHDRDFLISTLPSAPYSGGTAKVQGNGKGVQIGGILYWHDAFRLPALAGKRVPVRLDPFDVSHVYAWRPDTKVWLRCQSQHHATFRERSWKEVQILGKQIREQARGSRKTPRITAAILAPFLSGVRKLEGAENQRLKDAARDAVAARAVTPRLVTQDGVRVGDAPDATPAASPAEFSAEDWDAAPDLGDFE